LTFSCEDNIPITAVPEDNICGGTRLDMSDTDQSYDRNMGDGTTG